MAIGWQLEVPVRWQFGVAGLGSEAAGVASAASPTLAQRPGTYQRDLTQQLARLLDLSRAPGQTPGVAGHAKVDDHAPHVPAGSGALQALVDDLLLACAAYSSRGVSTQQAAFLRDRLGLPIGRTASDSQSKAVSAAVAVTLHGLFAALAQAGWAMAADHANSAAAAASDDTQESDRDADAADPRDNGRVAIDLGSAVTAGTDRLEHNPWWALRVQVELTLAQWLRQLPPVQAAVTSGSGVPAADAADQRPLWRFAAAWLLRQVLGPLSAWGWVASIELPAGQAGEHAAEVLVLAPSFPEWRQHLAEWLRQLPYRYPMQPLRQPPRLNWQAAGSSGLQSAPDEEQFAVAMIGYRRHNRTLARWHAGQAGAEADRRRLAVYVSALNAQMAVPWRVNTGVLRVMDALWSLHATPESVPPGTPQDVCDFAAAMFGEGSAGRRSSPGRGAWLRAPLAHLALRDLAPAAAGQAATFFLPWKADYRGRIYGETPFLTPQGGDTQRALMEFAEGRALDDAGANALAVHGARLLKREVLGADGRTLAAMRAWAAKNADLIATAADAPLVCDWWLRVSNDPLQFLAFCRAYTDWWRDRGALVHLPVQIDGTCNGLQHIAAITGDKDMAAAVNVLPGEPDALPRDLYDELAQAVGKWLADKWMNSPPALDANPKEDDPHQAARSAITRWLAGEMAPGQAQSHWASLLGRSAAKPVVMTVPYGAGESAQVERMLADVVLPLTQGMEEASAPLWVALDACGKLGLDLEALRSSLPLKRRSGQTLHAGLAQQAWRLGDSPLRKRRAALLRESSRSAVQADDPRLRRCEDAAVWCVLLAQLVVRCFRDALDQQYPVVGEFKRWLGRVARDQVGAPLAWISPIGFPVIQPGFTKVHQRLTATLRGGQRLEVGHTRLTETLCPVDQASALMPNLIHSLDATHLMLTVQQVKQAGAKLPFGSVHDCLLCHPNDAATWHVALREAFVALYGGGRSGPGMFCAADWAEAMQTRAWIARSSPAVLAVLAAMWPDAAAHAGRSVGEQALPLALLGLALKHCKEGSSLDQIFVASDLLLAAPDVGGWLERLRTAQPGAWAVAGPDSVFHPRPTPHDGRGAAATEASIWIQSQCRQLMDKWRHGVPVGHQEVNALTAWDGEIAQTLEKLKLHHQKQDRQARVCIKQLRRSTGGNCLERRVVEAWLDSLGDTRPGTGETTVPPAWDQQWSAKVAALNWMHCLLVWRWRQFNMAIDAQVRDLLGLRAMARCARLLAVRAGTSSDQAVAVPDAHLALMRSAVDHAQQAVELTAATRWDGESSVPFAGLSRSTLETVMQSVYFFH